MNCYGSLASWYDKFTGDVPYEAFAELYEAEFARCGGEFRLLLDLCCGTGTLTRIMAERGYELIGVDASVDMLMQAREKSAGLSPQPLLLCQRAEELDLYGTVDAAYCSLDGMNYIPHRHLPEVLRRLHLFIRPEGLFIFDIRPAQWLESLNGQAFVDETEDALCLWRAEFDPALPALRYGMNIFSRGGELWRRSDEEHIEYAHSFDSLKELLTGAGFDRIELIPAFPQAGDGRIFIRAVNLPH